MSDENDLDEKITEYLDLAEKKVIEWGIFLDVWLYSEDYKKEYKMTLFEKRVKIEEEIWQERTKEEYAGWRSRFISRDEFLGWYREQSLEVKTEVCDNIQEYLDRKPMTPEEKREYQEWLELTCPF